MNNAMARLLSVSLVFDLDTSLSYSGCCRQHPTAVLRSTVYMPFIITLLFHTRTCSSSINPLHDAPLLPYGYIAIKHPVPARVKPSFVIFDIRAI